MLREILPEKKLDFLNECGEMGKRIRAFDWSKTSLGPLEKWSDSLINSLTLCLNSAYPSIIYGGPDFLFIYNDAYIPLAGRKHPDKILGLPFKEARSEIWDIVGPKLQQVVDSMKPVRIEDELLAIDRKGFIEEYYVSLSYTPIRNYSEKVQGVFAVVFNTTSRIIQERHLKTLKDLEIRAAEAKTVKEAYKNTMEILDDNNKDIPFALLYELDIEHRQAYLVSTTRSLLPATLYSPTMHSLDEEEKPIWPFAKVIQEKKYQVTDTSEYHELPKGYWNEISKKTILLPIFLRGSAVPNIILIIGTSPRRVLDESYIDFLKSIRTLIASAIINAKARENEAQRIIALTELDQSKSRFFSNISHELRTPLTLLLRPIEDALADTSYPLPPSHIARVQLMQRSAHRLLRLINTLLDFTRIEARRVIAHYEETDIITLTKELCELFRPAMQHAGLEFKLNLEPMDELIYIDHEMWEKIVFNLLSNALKYTLKGSVTVTLQKKGDQIEFDVIDTGVGIPESELPRIFERFFRGETAKARTQEGMGIGLSLSQELAKLHSGQISVKSRVGEGSDFKVIIPRGKAHLPADQIKTKRVISPISKGIGTVYVDEAYGWLPEFKLAESQSVQLLETPLTKQEEIVLPAEEKKSAILFVDDNADMRRYIKDLLSPHWEIICVENSEKALHQIKEKRPDLILADILLPGMDGLKLTEAIRQDSNTNLLPIILLSVLAGADAQVEGLKKGADDYVVKPFSDKELIARIKTHLALGKMRIEMQKKVMELKNVNEALIKSEQNYKVLTSASPVGICHVDAAGHVTFCNPKMSELFNSSPEEIDEKWRMTIHPEDRDRVVSEWDKAIKSNFNRYTSEHRIMRSDGSITWVMFEAVPDIDSNKMKKGYVLNLFDITEIKTLIKEREQFVDTLCHELRNPLNGIYGAVSLLRDCKNKTHEYLSLPDVAMRVETSFQEKFKHFINQVDEAIKTIDECARFQKVITDDVLTLSQLQARKVELNDREFDPMASIKNVISMLQSDIRRKQLDINLQEIKQNLTVIGDPDRFSQILMNLISNAIKFTNEKGKIRIELKEIGKKDDKTVLECSVEDTGIGMTDDEQKIIFKPYSQASKKTYSVYGGSGLGLSICKKFVEMMGGDLSVKSEKNKGSRFFFTITCKTLTKQEKAVSIAAPAFFKPKLSTENISILIVEDIIVNQKIMERQLTHKGYKCTIANNGQEAVSRVTQEVFDIILMDIEMPIMNGLDATVAIRKLEKNPSWGRPPAIIIGVSGCARSEFLDKAKICGMNDYMIKPIEIARLTELMNTYLHAKGPQQPLKQEPILSSAKSTTL